MTWMCVMRPSLREASVILYCDPPTAVAIVKRRNDETNESHEIKRFLITGKTRNEPYDAESQRYAELQRTRHPDS